MKKNCLSYCIISLVAASLVSTASFAKDSDKKNFKGYKDQCPQGLVLKDGLYVGAAAGYDSYRMVDDVDFVESTISLSLDPRLSVNGAVGGGFIGIGHSFPNFYNTYIAIELFGNGSAAQTTYETIVESPDTLFKTNVDVTSNYGIGFLPGIKLTQDTLFYVRLGYNWTTIDVEEKIFLSGALVESSHTDVTSSGFIYGLGIEAAFYGNFSARGEFSHTDYSEFDTEIESDISPANNQFMLGLIYHFD